MQKFKKLNRAEMKEVVGGVQHACYVTCYGDIQESFVTVPDCIDRGGLCYAYGLGDFMSCTCR